MREELQSKVYVHNPELAYPDRDFVHMIESPHVHDYVYDEAFPYRLKDRKSRFIRFWIRVGIFLLVKPLCYIRYGLRIKGKKNIKAYKKMNKGKGMLSVCNHTTEWDILFVMTSRYFHFAEFPMWQEGAESQSGGLYRNVGGIVVPSKSLVGMNYAFKALGGVLDEGKWLHVFPEAACWAFYPAIRNFKTGIFKLAIEKNIPVLPMAVKYRRPKGLYKLFKKHPNATLYIGEPVLVDPELNEREATIDLSRRVRVAMMNLLGLSEEENLEVRKSLKQYHVQSESIF